MKRIIFEREKVTGHMKISKEFFTPPAFNIGQESLDFINDTLTVQIESFCFTRLNELQKIEIDFAPPTFWDWLFQRRKTRIVTFSAKEILKFPPELPDNRSQLIFMVKEDTPNEDF